MSVLPGAAGIDRADLDVSLFDPLWSLAARVVDSMCRGPLPIVSSAIEGLIPGLSSADESRSGGRPKVLSGFGYMW